MHNDRDLALIGHYPARADKGSLVGATRLTLLTARTEVSVGETLRVAHIVEECGSGRTLYGVGPKPIRDEYVDGVLVTAATPNPDDYPWLPDDYDGEATPSPGIDDAFAVTEYRFDQPGSHRIEWRPGRFRSNVLVLTVSAAAGSAA